jgi:hypothetical protein
MQEIRSWSLQKWLLAVGVFLCGGEWLQFCVRLAGRWNTMSSSLHKDEIDFAIFSLGLLVMFSSQKTRWVTPIIAAIFFATAASLALRSL